MINQKIAEQFAEIADMLEVIGESVFRIRAYRRASDMILGLSEDLAELHEKDDARIEEIPGIGKDLHAKIVEIIETGSCAMHGRLVEKLSPGILDILRVRSVGPKKAKLFYEQLGVDNIEKLKSAAESGALATLPGMGEKSEQAILTSLSQATHLKKRIPIYEALPAAEDYVAYMKKLKETKQVEYAGSLRRRAESIGDIDILASGSDSEKMSAHFRAFPRVKQVLAAGDTKSSVVLDDNIQVDFRVVDAESFGAALYYFTGSKYHNIQVRTLALKKGLKINEYGVYKGKKMLAGKTEQDLFACLGMDFVPPELREDQGEVEAALKKKLPTLIEEIDIRGDLHSHSKWSDGALTIYEMAKKAASLGREYLAITDHMRDEKKIKQQWKEIDEVEAKLVKEGEKIKILKGAEVSILKSGELNLDDKVLAELDIVLVSIHSDFGLSKKEQTERALKAFKNPHVDVFAFENVEGHGNQETVDLDFQKLVRAARESHIAFEINSQAQQMNMNGSLAKLCRDNKVKVIVDPLKFGLFMARRGWLEKDDVLNALPYSKLMKTLS